MSLVEEYLRRQKLAKLGVVTSYGELPAYKADAFIVIADKLDDLRRKKVSQ